MAEKYVVTLTANEYQQLLTVTSQGKISGRVFKRAHILLLAHEGHDDATIAQMLHMGESTIHRTRQKFVDGGVDFALKERPRQGAKRRLDGNAEAFLVATTCSDLMERRSYWTMQLLADRLIELEVVKGCGQK